MLVSKHLSVNIGYVNCVATCLECLLLYVVDFRTVITLQFVTVSNVPVRFYSPGGFLAVFEKKPSFSLQPLKLTILPAKTR